MPSCRWTLVKREGEEEGVEDIPLVVEAGAVNIIQMVGAGMVVVEEEVVEEEVDPQTITKATTEGQTKIVGDTLVNITKATGTSIKVDTVAVDDVGIGVDVVSLFVNLFFLFVFVKGRDRERQKELVLHL